MAKVILISHPSQAVSATSESSETLQNIAGGIYSNKLMLVIHVNPKTTAFHSYRGISVHIGQAVVDLIIARKLNNEVIYW